MISIQNWADSKSSSDSVWNFSSHHLRSNSKPMGNSPTRSGTIKFQTQSLEHFPGAGTFRGHFYITPVFSLHGLWYGFYLIYSLLHYAGQQDLPPWRRGGAREAPEGAANPRMSLGRGRRWGRGLPVAVHPLPCPPRPRRTSGSGENEEYVELPVPPSPARSYPWSGATRCTTPPRFTPWACARTLERHPTRTPSR